MKVWVARYEHRHGTDTRVFLTEGDCVAWRNNIAKEQWKDEIQEPMPEKPDDEIADEYFERMTEAWGSEEYFHWDECEVTSYRKSENT